jgi:hypothetical protein
MGRDLSLDTDPPMAINVRFSASDGRGLRKLLENGAAAHFEDFLRRDLPFLRYYDEGPVDEEELRKDYEFDDEEIQAIVAKKREEGELAWTSPTEASQIIEALMGVLVDQGGDLRAALVAGGHRRDYLEGDALRQDLVDLLDAVNRATDAGARRVRLAIL